MTALPEESTAENGCITHTNIINFSYKWIITNFSMRPEAEKSEKITSLIFSDKKYDQYGWRLLLHPIVRCSEECFVTLTLKLETIKNSSNGRIKADYKLSILNNKNEEIYSKIQSGIRFSIGYESMNDIDRSVLLNNANGLLPDDTLTIICQITTTFDTVTSFHRKAPDCEHKLIQDLGNLFENSKLKDVTLIVDNCEIQAHKVILAARSTVFDAMFEHELEESKTNRVSIADIRFEVVREMLRFMYTGKVLNLDTMAHELFIAADKYAITDLKELCELELSSKITAETSAKTLILADRHGAGNLKAQAIEFINVHVVEVLQTQGWKDMMESHKDLVTEAVEAIATWNGPPRKLTKN